MVGQFHLFYLFTCKLVKKALLCYILQMLIGTVRALKCTLLWPTNWSVTTFITFVPVSIHERGCGCMQTINPTVTWHSFQNVWWLCCLYGLRPMLSEWPDRNGQTYGTVCGGLPHWELTEGGYKAVWACQRQGENYKNSQRHNLTKDVQKEEEEDR